MIAKASQRANGQQLAIHLLNALDNERVEVAEISGAIARDLPGALKEWQAVSRASKCRKYLYSLSVNPHPLRAPLTRRQYKDFILRVEKRLGLSGQPRAVVFHIKEGREHCHVVWSRIIPDQLKAVQISHDRKTLQAVLRRFAKDHGFTLPENMRKPHAPKHHDPPRNVTLSEKQQQERSGIPKEQRVCDITRIWQESGTGRAFVEALAQAGYLLASGKSVPYVILDSYGEIHSLPRQIEGVKTRDVRTRLKDISPEALPDAATLREKFLSQLNAEITPLFNKSAHEPWERLKAAQDQRRAVFHKKLAVLKQKHKDERTALIKAQKEALRAMRESRTSKTGLVSILFLVPGLNTWIARRHKKQDMLCLKQFKRERQTLLARQQGAFDDLKRQMRAIERVERREARSLKTRLRREFLQARLTDRFATAAHPPPAPSTRILKLENFRHTATDITRPARSLRTKSTPVRHGKKPDPESLTFAFTETPLPGPSLRQVFNQTTIEDEPDHARQNRPGYHP